MASKHIAAKHEEYTYIDSSFDIGIVVKDGDHFYYKKLIQINVERKTEIYGEVFVFKEPEFIEFDPYCAYSQPLGINIDAYSCYQEVIVEEYYESEDEDEPDTIKSFREDKCVVCLSKEPKVLFYDCMHYCVCLECEEIKPFKRCPCCRTRISTKII